MRMRIRMRRLHRHSPASAPDRPVTALVLLFAASALCTRAWGGRQLQAQAPLSVSSAEQLVSALASGRPILLARSIFLDNQLPIVNSTVSITGDPVACRLQRQGYCRIDCKKKCRQFEVAAGGVLSLNNLMLARGVAPESQSVGGAILVRSGGAVSCNVVIFRFNGARGATSGGGAVEVESGAVFRASNCLFSRNFAGFGGAVAGAKSASIHIVDTFFNRNTALTAGGAVSLVLNTTASLSRNDYHGNVAAIGGAIHVDGSTSSICAGWDHANNATLVGPQVYAANYARILGCRLSFNFVVLASGASVVTNCGFC